MIEQRAAEIDIPYVDHVAVATPPNIELASPFVGPGCVAMSQGTELVTLQRTDIPGYGYTSAQTLVPKMAQFWWIPEGLHYVVMDDPGESREHRVDMFFMDQPDPGSDGMRPNQHSGLYGRGRIAHPPKKPVKRCKMLVAMMCAIDAPMRFDRTKCEAANK